MISERKYVAGWKINTEDKACYIDVEEEQNETNEIVDDDPDNVKSKWSDLPDLLLEQIFSYLNLRERYFCSLACKNWHRTFYLPRVWAEFLVVDETLARPKYNYYSGWQHVLDHARTQNCLLNIGKLIRGLDFRPIHSFNNMYQFMQLFSWSVEQGRKSDTPKEWIGCGQKVKYLNYVFPCNQASVEDPETIQLFGTGGQLLAGLKRLMWNLTELKSLKLTDLMLVRYDANHLLDEVLESCSTGLKRLHLINLTKVHCPIMHVGLFFNLKELVISPQNIDDDVLQLIADSKIHHLFLYQNRYSPESIRIMPCSDKAWQMVKKDNPKLQVHLRIESTSDSEVLIQPSAPVCSMTYQSPKTMIKPSIILNAIDMYKFKLAVYGHEMLPEFECLDEFNNRIDSLLVLLSRSCPNLHALMIREKISSATVLLLARTASNLQFFYVRKNCVILECEWPQNPDWCDGFYNWLCDSSRSYEETEKEVSQILQIDWKFLTDEQFQKVSLKKHIDF